MTSRGPLYTVCKVWGDPLPFLPGKSHIIPWMEKEMTLFKSLIPSRGGATAPARPEKDWKYGEFADCVIADR